MATRITRGTLRASKGYAIFRILFGLFFIGLGINQFSRNLPGMIPYFSFGVGVLFIGMGITRLVAPKIGASQIELETEQRSATDRLADLTQMKTGGLISTEEYETKRQEILKDL